MTFPARFIADVLAAYAQLDMRPEIANGHWHEAGDRCSPLLAIALPVLWARSDWSEPRSKGHAAELVGRVWRNWSVERAFMDGWLAQGYLPLRTYPWREKHGRCSVWYDAAVELRRIFFRRKTPWQPQHNSAARL